MEFTSIRRGHIVRVCGLILFLSISQTTASWGSPDSGQYHIQTDEGPERYFRYLTDNGQYRKEKRLQDGTVIGTDAWIDASGFLRQKDYIADGGGYRILKSKTIYVGKGQPIGDALRSIKNLPTDSNGNNKLKLVSATQTTTTLRPLFDKFISTTTPTPLYYDHPSTPSVFIQPNSQPVHHRYFPVKDIHIKPTPIPAQQQFTVAPLYRKQPSLKIQPPYNILGGDYEPIAADYSSSTPSPISSTQLPITSTSLIDPYPTQVTALNTEILPPLISPTNIPNELYDYVPRISSTTPIPTPISSTESSILTLNSNNLEPRPLYTRPATPRPFSSRNPFLRSQYDENIGNGYDPQLQEYDGVAINNDGFRYYLPRHYHEEENTSSDRRAGSFGYIDPFGIRRVVYYNTSPEGGFVHRKNNRYVGFDATPYDPRPL